MKCHASAILAFVSVTGLGIVLGCAKGNTGIEPSEDFLATEPADAGATEDDAAQPESVKLPPPSKQEPEDAGVEAGPTKSDAGSDAGAKDAGSPSSCSATNKCTSATDLGEIAGDMGTEEKTAEGSTSSWFTIRVTEKDPFLLAVPLWMTATLTSPPGTNYDLYVYVPKDDTTECTTLAQKSTNTSSADSAKVTFGETTPPLANEVDDARTVTVEVRHVSGSCDPSKKWKLTLTGNK